VQLIATGKWSKVERQWKMVVALRRPASDRPRSPLRQDEHPKVLRLRPRTNPDS